MFYSNIRVMRLKGYQSKGTNEWIRKWINEYIGFEKNFGQIQSLEGTPVYDVLFRAKL
ncbi:MAG: hypothetical protein ABDH49_02455 [Candidatus Hydrothermales bacterium]